MAQAKKPNEKTIARLRYRCRRGMLELDALLANFISSPQFNHLTEEQINIFDLLLDEPDPQLLRWFMGQEVCENEKFNELVTIIKNTVA